MRGYSNRDFWNQEWAPMCNPTFGNTAVRAVSASTSWGAENAGDCKSEGLPAVVSVKKSSRGCAVVILRNSEVWERSILQKVAVIDGVCVEVKKHEKRSLPAEEQPMGVFIAWGYRVERRVTISEEGIEDYFNGLAGVPRPEGLVPKAPFEECCQRFALMSAARATLNQKPQFDKAEPSRLLDESPCCSRERIGALWEAKGRLDAHWEKPPPPMGRSLLLRVARSQLFPHSGEGSKEHENRAGDKLAELIDEVSLLDQVPKGSAFLDLCGGPGAWSQFLLGRKDLALRGFGFTLRSQSGSAEDWHAQEKDDWYEELLKRPDWRALWGKDGTGDLLKPGNLEHCAAKLAKERVFLCLADGGFSDDAIPPNLQELYFYRLFLAELLMAASCLEPGGRFVCKLYSTFSVATASLLFLTTRLFESVSVVKPKTSRVTGPERYLVAFGFKSDAETKAISQALACSHRLGNGASPLTAPLLSPVVAAKDLTMDKDFVASLQTMSTALCDRQTSALNAAVDRAEFLEETCIAAAEGQDLETVDSENINPNKLMHGATANGEKPAKIMAELQPKQHQGLNPMAPEFNPAAAMACLGNARASGWSARFGGA